MPPHGYKSLISSPPMWQCFNHRWVSEQQERVAVPLNPNMVNDVTCFSYFQGVTEAGVLVFFLFFLVILFKRLDLKKNLDRVRSCKKTQLGWGEAMQILSLLG